ncbi:STAS/SEC14 domain-containing protein [Rubritalea spongiae]|uniref:STAS/SEC14 domain-containing protein n=1 Tax=Rubritalea spongiae TaxID=430797 RepID=A0ABW5EAV9_9BACT
MITLTKINDKRLNLEVTGTLVPEDMSRALEDFEAKTKGMKDGVLLYQLHDFEMPCSATMAVKLADLPRWFQLMHSIKKVALIADKLWIRRMAEFESLLLPGITIKSFEANKGAAAEAWLAE